jgi:AraC-like DNA-binding protein
VERLYASEEPIDAGAHRILLCSDRIAAPIAERILPDGAIHLIFNLGDQQAGERGAHYSSVVTGATCRPTRIVLTGALEQVCVRLRVGAAAAILGVPAGEVYEQGVSLEALWGKEADETRERLHAAAATSSPSASPSPSSSPRVQLLATLLAERIRRAESPPPVVFEAVRRITAAAGQLRVGALAAELGMSDRRLQQIFHLHVGLSPKALCRLARFRAVLALRPRVDHRINTRVEAGTGARTATRRSARASGPSWIELALAAGFYDQAHLTHELREFTGLTPGELARVDFGFFQDAPAVAG